jgi:hypothetical protein
VFRHALQLILPMIFTAARLRPERPACLQLSAQEAARLAPAVTQWLAAGVLPTRITEHLTNRLPDHLLVRPAGILAFRLKETPLPAVPAAARVGDRPTARPAVLPFQTCDGCERAFRSAAPGRCRRCRDRQSEDCVRAAG